MGIFPRVNRKILRSAITAPRAPMMAKVVSGSEVVRSIKIRAPVAMVKVEANKAPAKKALKYPKAPNCLIS